MSIGSLIKKWSGIGPASRIIIITDQQQKHIAQDIQGEKLYPVEVVCFAEDENLFSRIRSLKSHDLLMVMLSVDTYMNAGANAHFTAFEKPEGVAAKYLFVRLDISKDSLVQGLSTEKSLVYDTIAEMNRLGTVGRLRVKSESGTDMTVEVAPFTTCAHEITQDEGFAFIPPSEVSAEVLTGTAEGRIVVDMTVGQLYHFGRLMGYFGQVTDPVTLIVREGMVTDIQGGAMAAELKEKLFSLPAECRRLVELGHGLSKMEPTGLIGVDESIIDSCHFGFGDGWQCGTHLDVVIHNPTICAAET